MLFPESTATGISFCDVSLVDDLTELMVQRGPEFSSDETWSKLSANIREIHKHNASNLSFEENHRFAYNMVLHRNGEKLYNGVCQLVAENLAELAKNYIFSAFPTGGSDDRMQQTQEGETMLKALRRVWDDHTGSMAKLRDILRYMVFFFALLNDAASSPTRQDRVYCKSAEVPQIWDAGVNLFYKHIVRPPISEHFFSAILSQVQIEREGFVINRSAVKECVDILLLLKVDGESSSVYKRDLEPMILRASEAFYKAEGDALLETCDTPEYLRRVIFLHYTIERLY